MKTFTTAVQTALEQDEISFFALIKLEFRSQTVYVTDYARDLSFGGNTYVSDGGLSRYTPPKQSPTVDRESYRLEFLDFGDEFQDYFRAGAINSPVSIDVGFVINGSPDLTSSNIISIYRGRISEVAVENDTEQKRAVITLASPMAKLEATNSFFTNKSGMAQRASNDTSFDLVYAGAEEINLKWGKI